MKICFICWNLYTYGGIQRVLASVLNEMVKYKDLDVWVLMEYSKNDVNIFELDNSVRIENFSTFRPYTKKTFQGFICKGIQQLNLVTGILDNGLGIKIADKICYSKEQKSTAIEFIRNKMFDVVVGVGDSMALFLASIKNSLDCKCIGWMHSTFDSYYKIRGQQSFGMYAYSKKQYKNLDYLLVLTDKDKQDFEAHFNVRAIKLNNPVNYYCDNPSTSENNPIIFTGRMVKDYKGLDYLVRIIETIHKKEPKRKFILIGDGPDGKWLSNQIDDKKLAGIVTMVGMKNNVDDYLKKGSVFVHTSRYEGFGVVIIEAMMFGLPVVAFHNNGPDEIIEDNVDGYLVEKFDCEDFANKVMSILNNPEQYKKMSIKANKKALQFTPQIIVQQLIEILQNN